MCGFIGGIGSDYSLPEFHEAARLLAHRGPDGSSAVECGDFKAVACRLAIVPPFHVSTIMRSDRSTTILNGEVYGLEDPERRLTTDTERLARKLEREGTGILGDLRGLFAVCHYDGRNLLLARDRFGIKPLYYARTRRGLVFASEIKALLALPGFSREPDKDVLAAFDVVGYNVLPGRTPFRHIRSLLPGRALRVAANGTFREFRFASLPPAGIQSCENAGSADDTPLDVQIEKLLSEAVRRAMEHDPHPKALFFSGGIDSTLLLDFARSFGSVTPFVLADRNDSDDLIEARKIAAEFGVRLEEHRVGPADLDRDIVHYAWYFEHPIASGAFDLLGGVAFHSLARRIGKDFRVALCGEGADEIFLGYHRIHMAPTSLLQEMTQKAKKRATPPLLEWLQQHGLLGASETGPSALRNLALRAGLSEYHLPSVDRSGMAFSLEVRPPYLDEALTDLVIPLPEKVFLDHENYWTKIPLRAIARRRFRSPAAARAAIRRKRAMPSAVSSAGRMLMEKIFGCSDDALLRRALYKLFHYLHVDPGLTAPPDLSLSTFVREIAREERLGGSGR